MGTDSMIPVPDPLDKYDTGARPVPSWVPTIRVPAGTDVSMGIHGNPWIFEFIYFLVQIINFFNYQKTSTFKHPYIIHSKFHKSYIKNS
jgi:hypothetical protein